MLRIVIGILTHRWNDEGVGGGKYVREYLWVQGIVLGVSTGWASVADRGEEMGVCIDR